ncbi:MAG: FkbM family methyltransferase [Hyphomicrobiales bacterium]|nr:FkbM family methyltransferase [Hyphomicrobiales bacterium]MBV8824519.1 FkbM family methyltransferase [Hyphomicrobiales bacterium]
MLWPTIEIYDCRHGRFAHFRGDRDIGRFLEKYGEWAEVELALLKQFIPKGGLVLDVGANIGTHAIAFARMVGADGAVIAIEAVPVAHALLCFNALQNGLTNIVQLNAIASSTPALVRCRVGGEPKDMGLANFKQAVTDGGYRHAAGIAETTLAAITLDSLSLQRCDLIKIDVEMMEYEVLCGAVETIRSLHPVLYFEQTQERHPDFPAIYELLKSLGYRLYWHIANPFNRRNFRNDRENIFDGQVEVNVLACTQTPVSDGSLTEVVAPIYNPPVPLRQDAIAGVDIA